ncbi:helix-turn-helix domain-containing protein [Pseudomonas sp. PNP]
MALAYDVHHVSFQKKRPKGRQMKTKTPPPEIPSDPELRWEWIKFQLRAKGTSLAKVARKMNVSISAVLNVKRLPYPRMERAIAKALGLEPNELWPDRWNANGTPQRQRPKRPESSTNPESNVL